MALSNYTELQAAVRTEMRNVTTGGLTADALTDCIARAESKINRKTRLREAEQISTATYSANDNTIESRRIAMPTNYVEILDLRWKVASQQDTAYEAAIYVAPERIHEFYTGAGNGNLYYTLRSQIEFNRQTGGTDYEIMMHYIKAWDIASDATNWLLTNYPDAYLYGACAEVAGHMRSEEVGYYKALFEESLRDLDDLSQRGRDDAEMDLSDITALANRRTYNILST